MKGLTVEQLINALEKEDPKALVAVSADSEGNSFSLISNSEFISNGVYIKNELGGQEDYFEEKDMKVKGEYVKDLFGNEVKKTELGKCIILWSSK